MMKRLLMFYCVMQSTAFAGEVGVTDKEIVLGATMPMSGPVGFYGEMTKGSRAYFSKINDEGGIYGRKIRYVIEDDQYNPAKTVPATRKLVEQDKVFGMFQALGFPHTAVAKYLEQKQVPTFQYSDGSKSWDEFPNAIRGMVSWTIDGKKAGEYVAKHFAGKTVGFLYENSNLGKEGMDGTKSVLGDKVKYGPEEAYNPGSPNADAQTLNLMNAKVDVVVVMGVPNVAAAAMILAKQKAWKPTWVLSYVNADPVLIALGGDAVEGAVSSAFFKLLTNNDPAVEEHKKLLQKYFPGTQASLVTIYGQASAELMVEALKKAGPKLTRASALKAAKSFDGLTCSVCLYPAQTSDKDRDPWDKLRFMEVKGGQWVFAKEE